MLMLHAHVTVLRLAQALLFGADTDLQRSRKKVKEGIVLSEIHLPQNYGTPLVNWITQCYLPPDRGERFILSTP